MPPSENYLRKLGKQIVEAMLIGRKPNQAGLQQAEKVFPKIMAGAQKLEGKKLAREQLLKMGLDDGKIAALMKPDFGPVLVKRGGKFVFRTTMGESVRLRYHSDNWLLAKHIILEAGKRGASVLHSPGSSEFSREQAKQASIESLEDFTPLSKAIMQKLDVTIYLEDDDDPEWRRGLPREKLLAGREKGQRAHEILDERKVRWLYVGWPFAKTARKLGCSPSFFEKMVFASLEESFSKRTADLVGYYSNALEKTNAVRITHEDGSDLKFSIKGRPILRDLGRITQRDLDIGDVGLNLPSGEVFVSPLETSAEGRVFFPKIFVDGHGFTEELELVFSKGRVEKYSAEGKQENFDKYLAENTPSTRVLAELGIGCNKAANYSGYILTDEKIFGTIHLAIGNNTGSYHGKNKASGHLDMVKHMKKGVLYADGREVMVDGKPCE